MKQLKPVSLQLTLPDVIDIPKRRRSKGTIHSISKRKEGHAPHAPLEVETQQLDCIDRDSRKVIVAISVHLASSHPTMRLPITRSKPTSPRLTRADAIEIWKRRRLGEAIHSIAASFRVNPGRVAEVLNGTLFPEAERLSLI